MFTTTEKIVWGSYASPEAHITSKKSRHKLYDGKNIYLKDGTNFEIELFNPSSIRYMAKIWINGKLISTSGIVINPGRREYIERFIDENAKFEFKTYEVDNVEETKGAREKNGLVKICFYPEIQKFSVGHLTATHPPVFYDTYLYSSPNTSTTMSVSSFYSSTLISKSGNTLRSAKMSLNEAKPDSIETGRVSQGEKSSQKFSTTTGDFYQFPYFTFEYHLLPESLKAIEAQEIRNYCGECGIRIKKSNWKFCPNCGEKL